MATKAAVRDQFVGVRLTKAERRKCIRLSKLTPEPGSISAGLRLALNQARDTGGEQQPAAEVEVVEYA